MVTGARFNATTDTYGQTIIHLAQGRYELKVHASGFKAWEEEVEVNTEIQRIVILVLGPMVYCPCITWAFPEIPVEHQVLATEIPLIPMQQLELTAKPYRHKRHWF